MRKISYADAWTCFKAHCWLAMEKDKENVVNVKLNYSINFKKLLLNDQLGISQ